VCFSSWPRQQALSICDVSRLSVVRTHSDLLIYLSPVFSLIY
jgi:hypothetical protein